jgi:hypothetical protein
MPCRTPRQPVVIQALRRLRRDSSSSDQARQPNHHQQARPGGVTRASASERNRRPSRTSPHRQQERAPYWRCPDPVDLRRPATRNPSATSSTESGSPPPDRTTLDTGNYLAFLLSSYLDWPVAAGLNDHVRADLTTDAGRSSATEDGGGNMHRTSRDSGSAYPALAGLPQPT